MESIVLCITGASGVVYGIRLLEFLKERFNVYLVVSDNAFKVLYQEMNITREEFIKRYKDKCKLFFQHQIDASISSGSVLSKTKGVIVAPCSISTLSAVANGLSLNLIHRVCDVALKERKKLFLLVREMPLSLIHVKNMEKIFLAGGEVAVASPSFYTNPKTVDDMIDFVVGKVLDSFGIEHSLYSRWKENESF